MSVETTEELVKSENELALEKQLAEALKEIEALKKKVEGSKTTAVPKGKRRVFIVPSKIQGDYSTRVVDGITEQFVAMRTNGKKSEVLLNKQVDIEEALFQSHESFFSLFEVK